LGNGSALATEQWWRDSKTIAKTVNPGTAATAILFDRSYEDRYTNPSQPDTKHNQARSLRVLNVLPTGEILMLALGASPGRPPFNEPTQPENKTSRELWRSAAPSDCLPFWMPPDK